jgi:membrane-bound metal-dependent hydrolase YbcI (DUF457 family)
VLARTHLVTGVVAWEVVALNTHTTPVQMATGLVLVPCAALLPDFDHHNATITKTYGPATAVASWMIAKVCGGHRNGTHSAFGVLMLGGLLHACVTHRHTLWAQLILCAVLIPTMAAGVRVLKIPGWLDDAAAIPLVIGIVFLSGINLQSVPIAMMTGCAVHIAGDCLTNSGCPILWPLTKERFSMHLFPTGKWVEKRVIFWVLFTTMVGLYGCLVWHSWAPLL